MVASLWLLATWPAIGDRAPNAELAKGAFYGKVLDLSTGRPVADATVALRDRHGKVVAWTKTDEQGRYTIAADSLKLLQLRPSRHRGLLAGLAHGVGEVVTAPVKLAGAAVDTAVGVVKEIDPVRTAASAAVSAATANPGPVMSQVGSQTLNAFTDKAKRRAAQRMARSVLGERQTASSQPRKKLLPGEVSLAVSAPGYQEARGIAGAYWLEAPARTESPPTGPRAWLETVQLAPAGSDKKSTVEKEAILLAEPRLDPSLALPSTPVTISVKLETPEEQPLDVRVFAREDKTHHVVELQPQGNGLFSGELPLARKAPHGDTTVTVAALRAQPLEVDLSHSKGDALLKFAERLDDLHPNKPYRFDPRVMASENRLDLPLTILDPKQQTPARGKR